MRSAAVLLAALLASGPALAQTLTVVGLDGRETTLDAAQIAALPRGQVTITESDKSKAYEGTLIGPVLRAAGVPLGPRLHGDPLKAYAVVTGRDGFAAVYALAEFDKDFQDDTVILADRQGGTKLDEKHGPWRLVSSGDRKGWRSVYAAQRIELHAAAPARAISPRAMLNSRLGEDGRSLIVSRGEKVVFRLLEGGRLELVSTQPASEADALPPKPGGAAAADPAAGTVTAILGGDAKASILKLDSGLSRAFDYRVATTGGQTSIKACTVLPLLASYDSG
ncbi:MAG: hypothetical protein Q8M88_02180, partial [Phenylobacterium sp.]|uniref:hypothetical protein n=1 Tax=Phenylobacterium sp. TaxID=1871053 RepID=UPI002736A103